MMELMHLSRIWSDVTRRAALECGVPDSYRPILMYLSRHPGENQKALASFWGKTTAAVNQTVKAMEKGGYLCREADAGDMRVTRLYLTEKGTASAEKVRERLRLYDSEITSFLGEERESALASSLKELSIFIEGFTDGRL